MPWICQECKEEIWSDLNMVMLKNELWLSIANKSDVLCDICITKRLKRPIRKSDLMPDALCNKWYMDEWPNLQESKSLVNKILKEASGS